MYNIYIPKDLMLPIWMMYSNFPMNVATSPLPRQKKKKKPPAEPSGTLQEVREGIVLTQHPWIRGVSFRAIGKAAGIGGGHWVTGIGLT